jgi:mannose-1-phosphate guanylyltransferase
MNYYCIILCGGNGKRLWPYSTNEIPKQFLKIYNDITLLQNTLDRIPNYFKKIFVTSGNFYQHIIKYVTGNDLLILEPYNKNTGPAIISACKFINNLSLSSKKESIITILPCDHILNNNFFYDFDDNVIPILFKKDIILYGKKPTYIETEYGYIVKDINNNIQKFIEKPNITMAEQLCNTNNVLWNMGIFIFSQSTINKLIKIYCNDMYDLIKFYNVKDNIFSIDEEYFYCDDIPFDKLVIEKHDNNYVIEYLGEWSDIGNWNRLHDVMKNKLDNDVMNVHIGNNIYDNDSNNILVFNNDENKKIYTIGLNNLILINTNKNILVVDKNKYNLVNDIIKNTQVILN